MVVVQIFNKSKSKLLNYGYFTIFAPFIKSQESGDGSPEHIEYSTSYL